MSTIGSLFTYGTLRKYKEPTHKLVGYRLFAFKGNFDFPYVVPATDSSVYGNIVETSPNQLKAFDSYEGVERGFYIRTQVSVENIKTGRAELCWVYEAGKLLDSVTTPAPISSGDWFKQ